MRTVIAAHDGREHGLDAVARGREIAEAAGARLLVVHIMEKQTPYWSVEREHQHMLRDELEEIFAPARAIGGPLVETRAIGASTAVIGLLQVIEDEEPGVVVIGASHRGVFGHVLYGDIARQVERNCDCHVEVAPVGCASMAAAA
jgi:nucleotide-binding universal stress UspA family protein